MEKLDSKNVEEILALTPVQEGMLFHYLQAPESESYFEQLCLGISGEVDFMRFKKAWDIVIDTNEMLRTAFRWEYVEKPVQIVLKKHGFRPGYYDFTGTNNGREKDLLEEIKVNDREEKFHLGQVPFRVTLCKVEECRYEMIISNHHIIYDGWSSGIILKEFFDAYRGLSAGKEPVRPVKTKFKEFIRWTQNRDIHKEEKFWEGYLADYPRTGFSGGRRVKKITSTAGCRLKFPRRLNEPLRFFVKQHRITLSCLFYSAWGILLQKLNSVEDIVYDTTVSGRPAGITGIEAMVGLFINTLPLRVDTAAGEKITDFLMRMYDSLQKREAFANSSLSPVKEYLEGNNRHPLFDSVVIVENYPLDKRLAGDSVDKNNNGAISIAGFSVSGGADYDLTVIITTFADIEVHITYNRDLFSGELIGGLFDHFVDIVRAFMENPGGEAAGINPGLEEERTLILKNLEENRGGGVETPAAAGARVPRGGVEEKLAGVWAAVLKIDKGIIGMDADFFDFGGHSLKAGMLRAKIQEGFNVKVPLAEVFKRPSLEELADYIKREIKKSGEEGSGYPSVEPVEKREYYALSPGQERFYIMQRMRPDIPLLNMPAVLSFDGEIDKEKLHEVFARLTARHESLRTAVIVIDNVPVQRVYDEVKFEMEYYDLATEDTEDTEKRKHETGEILQDKKLPATNRLLPADFIRPFDLSRAPLFRAALISTGSRRDLLAIDIHHIVSDGVSQQVLARDFMSLAAGEELPPLKLRYNDFSSWQEQLNRWGKLEEHEQYWLAQLSEPLPELKLPTDYPRPPLQSYRGGTLRVTLPGELSRDLYALIRDTGTTLYMVLLAAYNILLHKYTGQSDIIVGSPAARRDHTDVENIIGLVMGSVMMRNFIHEEKTFREFLEEVKAGALQAYEHQVYPYENLLRKPGYKGETPGKPLTGAGLNVQEMFAPGVRGPRLQSLDALSYVPNTAKLDLTLNARERGEGGEAEGIVLEFEYSTDLFKGETIGRLAGRFRQVLHEIVGNPRVFIWEIDMISPSEKRELTGGTPRCFPLSHAQKRIYYTEKTYPGTGVNTLAYTVRYEEILDKEILGAAIHTVIRRHEGLRLRVLEFDAALEPCQYIAPYEGEPLDGIEFPGPDREEEIAADMDRRSREPFAFFNSALFYFAYIRFNSRESGYYMKVHHIAADGWTVLLLLREIDILYGQLKAGEAVDKTVVPSYIQYIGEEKAYLSSARAREDREFWHRTLLPLPGASPFLWRGGGFPDIAGGMEVLAFPAGLRERMHGYCRGHNTSVFKLVFTALAVYMGRAADSSDIVIGSANHNRPTSLHKQMAGMFVSTIPIRVKPENGLSFGDLVEKAGQDIDMIIKNHQKYPFDLLMEEIREKTGRDPRSLLEVNLVGRGEIRGARFNIHFHFPGFEPTPLALHINVNNRDIRGILEITWFYQSARFSREDILNLHRGLVNILTAALEGPGKPLDRIEILSLEEKRQILYEFNDTAVDYRVDKTVHELVEEQAVRRPGSVAVVGKGPGCLDAWMHGVVHLTYRELNQRAGQLAYSLREKGVLADDIVGIMVERTLEMIIGILGILKAGGAYLPIDPEYPRDRIDYMLKDSGAKILLTNLPEADLHHSAHQFITYNPGALAYVIYTSGSTGRPKGVMVEHRNLAAYLAAFEKEFKITPRDRVLQQASFSFDTFGEEVYPLLLKGGTVVIPCLEIIKDIGLLVDFIGRYCITVIDCSPLLLNELNKHSPPPGVRLCISGGDVLRGEHIGNLASGGREIYNTYGPTETTVCAAYFRCRPGMEMDIPIGGPISNYRIYILDGKLRLQPVGVAGELCISGAGVTRGYLNNPELTSEKFDQDLWDCQDYRDENQKLLRGVQGGGFLEKSPPGRRRHPTAWGPYKKLYKTGDLGRWLPDGSIGFLGRIDRQVKIRGYRIELGEIESCLSRLPGVSEVVVLDREDGGGNRYLCAYVVSSSSYSSYSAYLSGLLPGYMVPAYFLEMETIPRTPAGKVDRGALPEPQTAGIKAVSTPPRDGIEKRLARIWSGVLGLSGVPGIDDDFFQVGGHSIKAMGLLAGIQKEFSVDFRLGQVFKDPCIRAIAGMIKKAKLQRYQDIHAVEAKEYYPLSSAQKRLFFLAQFEHIGTSYNMPFAIRIGGVPDKGRFQETFVTLIERHETLRTSFGYIGGQPVQRVHEAKEVEFAIEALEAGGGEIDAMIAGFVQPFNLERPPLLRAALARPREKEYLLLFEMHHIISDGTSIGVLIDEFTRLYNRETLPPPVIRYRDFSLWQNRMVQGGKIRDQQTFWRNLYSDEIPKLDLPADFPRPAVFTFAGDCWRFKLEKEETARLRQMCARRGVTLFMSLMAVFNILLYKYGGEEDIIVGTAVAGRSHPDLQRNIGMFVNMLALRNRPRGEKTYGQFLEEIKHTAINAFENQDLQFEAFVDELKVERDASRNPLFDVCLVIQNFERQEIRLQGLTFTPYDYREKISQFDLALDVWELGEDIVCHLEYYTALFKNGTIRRFSRHFLNIIAQVCREPGMLISQIDILSDEEKHLLTREFNRSGGDYSLDKTVHELFAVRAAETPDSIAVVVAHELQLHLTYGELEEKSGRLARYLHDVGGIGRGDRVGLMMERSGAGVTAVLGILKAGAAYVPIDPFLPVERLKRVLADTGTGVLISQERFLRKLDVLQWECKDLHTFLCMDTFDIYSGDEMEAEELADMEKLWNYVGETAADEITGGGWVSSYTGEPFTREEMDEYGDNVLKKLEPLLHKEMRVLEIGCASGITMFRTAPRVGFYYGIDLSAAIIRENRKRIQEQGYGNIELAVLPAHEIDKIHETNFDLVILNSVVQDFYGHNYLRKVISKALGLMADRGYFFFGDIMDRDLKEVLARETAAFKKAHRDKNYKTKTDFSRDLFISREFFNDLRVDIPFIRGVEFSEKIYTLENELTRFRYDVLMEIDKVKAVNGVSTVRPVKSKYREDLTVLNSHPGGVCQTGVTAFDPAYIMFTSGTGGRPKGVVVEHRGVVNVARWFARTFHLRGGVHLLQMTDYTFDPSVEDMFATLHGGAALYVGNRELGIDRDKFSRFVLRHHINMIDFVPSALEQLLVHGEKLAGLEVVISGGERLEESLKGLLLKKGYRLYNNYGPTEITVDALFSECSPERVNLGKPIANTRCYVLDKDGHPAPVGVKGELCISGAGVSRGYLNSPELTSEKFLRGGPGGAVFSKSAPPGRRRQKLYKTGDLARWLPDGNIEFLGRIDRQVKIRGFRVELEEIESRILRHEAVREAVVMDRGDARGERYLCAYVVAGGPVDTVELRAALSRHLPDYMIPLHFMQMDRVPRKSSGKIDRRRLPDPGAAAEMENDAPPRNGLEKKLAGIWSGVLGIREEGIGIDSDFFQLGGHSLKAAVLTSRIHRELHIKVPLAEVFNNPTIRGLSAYSRQAGKSRHAAVEPVEKKEYYAPSSAQKRLYFLRQMDPGSTGYNMPGVMPFGRDTDKHKIESTLRKLIARHESLRTSFIRVNDEPVQRVHDEVEFEIEYHDLATEDTEDTEKRKQETREILPDKKLPTANCLLPADFIRPFDLSRAPLMRCGLIGFPGGNHAWMVDIHHIVSDGTSHTIIEEDFFLLYREEWLEPLRLQYKDFSAWQNRLFASGEIKSQEDYWLGLYCDAKELPRLELPGDYKRPAIFTFAGAIYDFKLEREDVDRLRAMSTRNRGTLYMNILALLNTLFYKYSGQSDIIIGTGIAGRPHADLQQIMGMFINTLAMRNYPEGGKTYNDFLTEVIRHSVGAFENQEVQFEELVDKLELERDASRNPVFDIMMVVQNFRGVGEGRSLQALIAAENHSPLEYEGNTAKFDMTFFVHEIGEDIHIYLEYYTAIFKKETIIRLAGHFKNTIKQVTANPGVRLKDIDILSPREKQELLNGFNDTGTAYPREKTIGELFAEHVEKSPDFTAVVFADECLTYKVLDREANRLANYLHYETGVGPDQRVGLLLDRSMEMIVAILGILKAGGAYVPISPSFPGERIKTMIDDAGIAVLIGQKRYIKTLNRLQWECGELDTFLCLDSVDVHGEEEQEASELMSRKLWEYVGETAVDEITGGGWNSSYTGTPIPQEEMEEYGGNILKKLRPLLHKDMRVLEIGAASGISMYRIAPEVGLYYGIDLSAVIIEKNRERVKKQGLDNIKLRTLAGHEIDQLEERNFHLVIINSVIQCFHGHNYLRKVIRKAVDLMASSGYMFIGDIMDQDLKEDLTADLRAFNRENRGRGFKTKIDWSEELFISRAFWEDLALDIPGIREMEFSRKICTIENELTRFRYDALFHIDKVKLNRETGKRHKHQHDAGLLRAYGTGKPAAAVSAGNLSYVMYTSGSTGEPKGALITHNNISRLVKNTNYIRLMPGDRVLQLSDYAFDGSVFDIFAALLNGSTLVAVRREDMLEIETLCGLIRRERIDVFFVTTALFNTIVDVGLESLSGVRKVLFGGERVSVPHARKALAYLGRDRILHMYGPTETTVYATYYPIDEIDENAVTVPIGAPVSNTWIYILDSGFKLLPIGVSGEIYIGGPGVCRGYLHNEALTGEKFIPDPFRGGEMIYCSGDLGRWTNGGYIEFMGRKDRQVKVRGYRIEPGEIESRLPGFAGINECIVVAREDEKGSRYLCAYFKSDETVGVPELKDYLSQVLPDFMVPSYFLQMEKLPLGRTGKIDQSKLPDPRLSLAENFAAPRDEIEEKIAGLWSGVLGIGKESIGIDANFFDLGGHSLKATVLTAKIHRALNVKVPLAEIFNRQTVREFCEYIRHAVGERFFAVDKAEKKEYYALAAAQKRLYIIQQMEPQGTRYNMPYMIPFESGLDRERLHETAAKLLERHESLRTSFHMINDEPVQRIHDNVEFAIDYYHLSTDYSDEKKEIKTIEGISKVFAGVQGAVFSKSAPWSPKAFDLTKAPLLRVGVLKAEHEKHILMVEMHHIISDGTSQGILEREFSALYTGKELPPPRLQYKDYAEWQNSKAQQAVMKKQEKYWLREFHGDLPVLDLPADYPRPVVQSDEGRQMGFFLDRRITGVLKELAKNTGTTLYMILLAVFNILLAKLSGQDDIIIGTPATGRRHAHLQDIIGMFVNTLSMRNYPRGDKRFIEFLQEVKGRTLDVYENQEYQFENLVENVSTGRDTGRNPIFDVMFNFLNLAGYRGDITGEDPDIIYDRGKSKANFDIVFQAAELEGVTGFTVDYCTKLFKEGTIKRFIRCFKRILAALEENPAAKISALEWVGEEEKRQLLVDFNDTAATYPTDKTIHELFERQAAHTPDRAAVVGQGGTAIHLTYRELNQRSHRLADVLRKKGVRVNCIVGIMMERSPELITGIMGILKAGGAYLPIDPQYPRERIDYMLKDSGAEILLTNLPEAGLHHSSHRFIIHNSDALAYVIYTSGTTGRPKGSMIDHGSLVNQCTWHSRYYEITASDHSTQYAGTGFDAAVLEIFPYLTKGAALHIISDAIKLDIPALKEYYNRHNITVTFLPTQFCRQFMEEETGTPSLRAVITGGEKLDHFVKTNYRLYNNYGPTENTVVAAVFPVERAYDNIPIGKPVHNNRIYILAKSSFQVQPIGVPGELCISGSGLSRGYLNQPELTVERFFSMSYRSYRSYRTYRTYIPGKIYKTGDLARWLADGNIEFLGRIDQQVKIRGFRIELGEISSRLSNHDRIKEAVVLDRGNEKGDNYLCAYFVNDVRADNVPDAGELRQYLSCLLPGYMIPSYFIRVENIPLTPSGKVDRKALRELGLGLTNEGFIPARSETEKILTEIWSDVLQIGKEKEHIGIDDSFFELGGHSLKATILVSGIHEKLHVKVPLVEVFKCQTVRALSKYIERVGKTRYADIKPAEKREYYALSSAQTRLYFIQRMAPASTGYNIPLVFSPGKNIEKEKLESTLKQLIARHESLRTSFINLNDEPFQRIHDHVEFEIEYHDLADFVRPFDLSRAPLIRSGLIKHPGGNHTWIVDIHHIISDGTSHTVLTEDFISLYRGEEPEPLRLQYKDFSRWQNHLFAGEEIKARENYWLELVADAGGIPRVQLPADYTRPEVFTFAGANYKFMLDNEDASGFRLLAAGHGGTLYMNILAVLNVLFFKYTGQTDILIGTGVAGRPHADLQRIIGMFINTLVMRNYPRGEKTYEFFLNEVIEQSVLAFENQDVQFEELVDKLGVERDPSRNPLFDISMVVQNFSQPGEIMEMASAAGNPPRTESLPPPDENPPPPEYENTTAKFDMTFFIIEAGDGIYIKIEYYTGIFKEDTVKRLSGHFKNIVKAIINDPSVKLKDIDIISPEEKKQVLYEFNDTAGEYPRDRTVHELFAEQAEKTPDKIAVSRPGTGNRYLTYRELNRKSNHLARYFFYEKEVRPDDRVGILMDSSLESIIAIMGVLKAGAAYLPLDPFLPEERIKNIVIDAGMAVMVSQKRFLRALNRLQWECRCFHTYLCMDTRDVFAETGEEKSGLMDKELWEYVGKRAADDIEAGGWLSSYTGEPISAAEMDEYGDNALHKLTPLFQPGMRVLEIGCASGLTMYRAAPRVGYYLGTDLSSVIIEKNRRRVQQEGHTNIALQCLPAHEIDILKRQERPFDLVIMNSVVQAFHGHNYLRQVIRKCIDLLGDKGYLFIGDIMDQDLKEDLVLDLLEFQRANRGKNNRYHTKTVFSQELFISRAFFHDLAVEMPVIRDTAFSSKIRTIENELTKFRYDVIITIDKRAMAGEKPQVKHKYQEDLRVFEGWAARGAVDTEAAAAGVNPGNLAYVIYTSGSTGKPRGVMVEHGSLVNLCWWHNRHFSVTPPDRATKYAGPGFDASVWEIFPYLIAGACLYIIDDRIKLEIEKLKHYFELHHIAIGFLPTQVCEQFMLDSFSPGSLRVLLTGGDKLQRYVKRSYRLVNNYGPTEYTVVTTSYDVSGQQVNIPIGRPTINTRLYILDRWHRLQPVGVPGELCIAGDGLARGYLNNPELTAEKFISAPASSSSSSSSWGLRLAACGCRLYKTGDLARWQPDGNIGFLGRVDHQVKIRGYRIEPGEIESCLANHPGIKEAVVMDRVDNNADKYLCAYIVSHSSSLTGVFTGETFDTAELKNYLSGKLPAYMVPQYFVKIGAIPLTANGKVDRKALLEYDPEWGADDGDHDLPGSEIEEKILEIWRDVLGIKRIGVNDNFFDIGGDSIKAIQVTARMRRYGLELSVSDLFLHPTINKSAGCLVAHRVLMEPAASSAVEDLNYSPLEEEELEEYEKEFTVLD